MKQSNATTEARAADARTFYRAIYGRMQHRKGLYLPIWRGSETETIWLDATDEDGYVEAVSSQEGGHVYTPVRLRQRKPTKKSSYGGASDLADYTEALFIDWDIASNGKADGADGELGYAPDKDVLRGLINSFTEEVGVPAHAVTETLNGYHSWHLVDPMDAATAADMGTRLEGRLAQWLGERGYKVDENVTRTPTRIGRAPGAYRVKHLEGEDAETEPYLVTVVSTSDAPPTPVSVFEALPRVLPVTIDLPVIDEDFLDDRARFSRTLPVSVLLEAMGWKRGQGRSWTAPVTGASHDSAHLLEASDGAEVLCVWSNRGAELLGVHSGALVSSADLVAAQVGDYRMAQRIWERAVEDDSGELVRKLTSLFKTNAERADFVALATQADAGWPQDLDRKMQSRLVYRGVDAEVAVARGYATVTEAFEVPGHDVEWALEMPVYVVNKQTGSTVQARVVEKIEVGEDGKPKRRPGRPRKDGSDIEAKPRTEGFNDDRLRGLALNPLAKDAVVDGKLPLIIVTQTEPGDDTDRYTPTRYAQVQADAVLSAARRERLNVGVLHAPTWASLIIAGGESGDGARTDQLHPTFGRVPLRGREVYLVSRSTWRQDLGLVQFIDLLTARGAEVRMLDVPRLPSLRPSEIRLDSSTWGIDDHLAENRGSDPLRRLIASALSADEARFQAHVPSETETAEMADVVVRSLKRSRAYLYDAVSKRWARDRGTHLQVGGAGVSPDHAVRKILLDHDVNVKSAKVLADVVRAVERDARIQIATSDLDKESRELPVLNGIVNLQTGKLRARPKGYLNSKVAPVVYDPKATAPNWEKFLLDSMLGEQDMVDHLQLIAGLCLIGEVIEEVMFFFYGAGRNGKSTFLNVLSHILGPYARPMPVELLASKASPFQLGDLRGVRMLMAPEAPRGMRMSDGALKGLVTRDPVSGERKFGDAFDFQLSLTLISAVNHLPSVLARDTGTWRRILIVPWRRNVSDAEADRGLEARLKAEAPGILRWAVEGAMKVLANVRVSEEGGRLDRGLLEVPDTVRQAVDDHKNSTDLLGLWMSERCSKGKKRTVKMADAHAEFNAWLEDEQQENRWKPATIQEALAELGVKAKRIRDAEGRQHRVYVGFDMTPPGAKKKDKKKRKKDKAEAQASGKVVDLPKRPTPSPQPQVNGSSALAPHEEEL